MQTQSAVVKKVCGGRAFIFALMMIQCALLWSTLRDLAFMLRMFPLSFTCLIFNSTYTVILFFFYSVMLLLIFLCSYSLFIWNLFHVHTIWISACFLVKCVILDPDLWIDHCILYRFSGPFRQICDLIDLLNCRLGQIQCVVLTDWKSSSSI